jgi:hypothetical protein
MRIKMRTAVTEAATEHEWSASNVRNANARQRIRHGCGHQVDRRLGGLSDDARRGSALADIQSRCVAVYFRV